jgi:hypothetical protein
MLNLKQLLHDYNIPYATQGEHRHANEGWINLNCPYHEGDFHLGYNIEGQYFHCWKCGGHRIENIISKLLHINTSKAKDIIDEYSSYRKEKQIIKKKLNKLPFSLPSNTTKLNEQHKKYLAKRNYDPDKLEKVWGLKGTGVFSKLTHSDGKEIDFKHRIVIPINWNSDMVSFQTRDRTGKASLKYISCPKDKEKIDHKSILYGNSDKWDVDKGICVEGVFDVWRTGETGFATFGTSYTPTQLKLINHYFNRVFILFDPEVQAQKKARALASELRVRGTEAHVVKLESDPGDMEQDDINHLIKNL